MSQYNLPLNLLPPLPDSPNMVQQATHKQGCPTLHSHWVIPQILMQGAYPKDLSPEVLKSFSLFVNVSEHAFFGDYRNVVERNSDSIHYIHHPIADYSIAPDSAVLKLVNEIVELIEKGRQQKNENFKVYIHCVGGKGRSGTICALVFGLLYNRQQCRLQLSQTNSSTRPHLMNGDEVLEWIQKFFENRSTPFYPIKGYSPETDEQCNQVRRLMENFHKQLLDEH